MKKIDNIEIEKQLADIRQKLLDLLISLKNDVPNWNHKFSHFARFASNLTGRPLIFNIAMLVILVWVVSGPIFGFSDTWQLMINTATTIITFLMVFLIQHTQNRDTEAMHVKLDELIRSIEGAHNALLNLEELEEEELELFRQRYSELAKTAREEMLKGLPDTGTPEIR
ncbi:MAG: low affinity iron permease family protein [Gammaproteobacteria bacterium]